MNLPPALSPALVLPEAANRTVARLTRRLALAAEQSGARARLPEPNDFLVPVLRPDLLEPPAPPRE